MRILVSGRQSHQFMMRAQLDTAAEQLYLSVSSAVGGGVSAHLSQTAQGSALCIELQDDAAECTVVLGCALQAARKHA